jgi:CheY-like chemotaxis protein
MDWEMPVMDGLTASREIRKLQAEGKLTRYLEIVATTANARDEQIAIALESGIVSFDIVLISPSTVSSHWLVLKIASGSQINTSPRMM